MDARTAFLNNNRDFVAKSRTIPFFRLCAHWVFPRELYLSMGSWLVIHPEYQGDFVKSRLSGSGVFIIKKAAAFNSFSHLLIQQISAVATTPAIPQVSSLRKMLRWSKLTAIRQTPSPPPIPRFNGILRSDHVSPLGIFIRHVFPSSLSLLIFKDRLYVNIYRYLLFLSRKKALLMPVIGSIKAINGWVSIPAL
jgi:hypothetical protein